MQERCQRFIVCNDILLAEGHKRSDLNGFSSIRAMGHFLKPRLLFLYVWSINFVQRHDKSVQLTKARILCLLFAFVHKKYDKSNC